MSEIVQREDSPPTEQVKGNHVATVIERVALNPDVDVDKMERIIRLQVELQERDEQKQAKQEFDAALAEFKKDPPVVRKDKQNKPSASR